MLADIDLSEISILLLIQVPSNLKSGSYNVTVAADGGECSSISVKYQAKSQSIYIETDEANNEPAQTS